MIGYKAFNPDWTCLGFQYQIGATYEIPKEQLRMCVRGFHFCQYPLDVLNYYPQSDVVYAEIRADGKIIEDDDKCVTNKITIIRPLTKADLISLMPPIVQRESRKEWYSQGHLHRVDGPAVEWCDGDTLWYYQGMCHRIDGPALDYKIHKIWYINDVKHRIDGPAIEWPNGDKEWFINGQRHRIDGPAIEKVNGHKEWWVSGKRHRDDGPAIEEANGDKEWWVNGQPHREGGPAIITSNGGQGWYRHGQYYNKNELGLVR